MCAQRPVSKATISRKAMHGRKRVFVMCSCGVRMMSGACASVQYVTRAQRSATASVVSWCCHVAGTLTGLSRCLFTLARRASDHRLPILLLRLAAQVHLLSLVKPEHMARAGRSPAGGEADWGAGDRRGSQPMWDVEAARGRIAPLRTVQPHKERENQPGLHGAPTQPASADVSRNQQ